ncbi:MAG: tRNA pseudouridine(54/55) synthase Pus10 [Candidatus Bathyarchaeia archaeon]
MTLTSRGRRTHVSDILQAARSIIESHRLCDSCLGRQFGNLGSGMSNRQRGASLKQVLLLKAHQLMLEDKKEGRCLLEKLMSNAMLNSAKATLKKTGLSCGEDVDGQCELCQGKLSQLEAVASHALEEAAQFEFDTFVVGAVIPLTVIEAEDRLRAKFGLKWGEAIKSEFTREIGKIMAAGTGKTVDFKAPDVAITVRPYTDEVSIQVNPLYVYGRYRKLVTGIPQSRWVCKKCNGRGCESCEGTGRKYLESVQELISKPLLKASRGDDTCIHASGREDIDAKVLGKGRPFVIEIKNPRKRNFSLKRVAAAVDSTGKVEVENLTKTTAETVKRIKASEASEKWYKAVAEADSEVSDAEIEKVQNQLNACTVKQRTPRRVLHRRADRTRERYIYEVKTMRLTPTTFNINIRCQGGLYAKELIHGDGGRTAPNVSEILGKTVRCVELTVMDVEVGEEP